MAEAEREITFPDEAIKLVIRGHDVEQILARCKINDVFERREWSQAASTLSTVCFCTHVIEHKPLTLLATGIIAMCDRHRLDNVTAVG